MPPIIVDLDLRKYTGKTLMCRLGRHDWALAAWDGGTRVERVCVRCKAFEHGYGDPMRGCRQWFPGQWPHQSIPRGGIGTPSKCPPPIVPNRNIQIEEHRY